MTASAGITLTDLTPHLHFFGREFISPATLPDCGERSLIRIADWDFRWQNTYSDREPVHLPAGSRIDAWVRHDNSPGNPRSPAQAPVTVTWGWEKSELWIGFIPDSPGGRTRIMNTADESWYRSAHVGDREAAALRGHLPALA